MNNYQVVKSVSYTHLASLKGKNDIAIGNIIGSNIFNILFVLGTASLVAPQGIPFASGFVIDGIIAIGAIVMFMSVSYTHLDVYKRQGYPL